MRELLLILVFASNVAAQKLVRSYIGMCHEEWPCDKTINKSRVVGFLAPPTFGERCECGARYLALPERKYARIMLINGTCFPERGRRCDKTEPFYGETIGSAQKKILKDDPDMLARLDRSFELTKRLLSSMTNADVDLGICLECPFDMPARKKLLSRARLHFPGFTFVDSVITQRCLPGVLCERHGTRQTHKKPCIADLDGEDGRAVDLPKYRKATANCKATLYWEPKYNCQPAKVGREFVLPRKRKCKL